MINEIQNGGRSHLEFIIFVDFCLNGPFLVATIYITAIFYLSTSSAAELLLFVQKIQDGGRRYLGFCFCSIFWLTCV